MVLNSLLRNKTKDVVVAERAKTDSLQISAALKAIKRIDPVVMILGRAGTGKTTLIRSILETDKEHQVVLAFTGVAALNVGGQTIHSFFQIPPRLHNLSEIQPKRGASKLFKNLKRIIIDEVSMVRADLLDTIDYALQINRKDPRPFGGVQIVLVGDFLQLSPIVRNDEGEILSSKGYKTPYAFDAKCLQNINVTLVELSTVYRQNDPEYVQLLGNLRSKLDLENTINAFNKYCLGPHKRDAKPVILAGKNSVVDKHNFIGLKELSGDVVTYAGTIEGEFKVEKDKLPAPELLALKVGARVMMVKNDKARKWVNGSLGTVTRLGENSVWVKLDIRTDELEIEQESWENVRYEWDDSAESITAKKVGSYTQIPVIPAWALTVHKAQGLTLENVRIDLENGAFASGQAYVALSRARSLEGLSFISPLRMSDIIVDPRLLNHKLFS